MAPAFHLSRLVDLLRAVGAQLIVWHHLAFYGPLSDLAHPLAPGLIEWLSEYGRYAVQLFFVLGGFTTAQSLAPESGLTTREVLRNLWKRYQRIAFPFLAALALAILANAVARQWMDHSSISAPPTPAQVLAHALFLHDLLGFEALSAGIWYLAIDFQLYAATLLVLALGARVARRLSPGWRRGAPLAAVLLLGGASAFWFNRDARFDNWAIYFFASYAFGLLVGWWVKQEAAAGWLLGFLALGVCANLVDFRPRLVLALSTALLLGGAALLRGRAPELPGQREVAFLGRTSYSLFLVHFPICLVVNAAWMRAGVDDPATAAAGMLSAWAASMLVAVLFHRFIEQQLLPARRSAPARHGDAAARAGGRGSRR